MFCHITQNWRATPLLSLLIVIELIAKTTTKTGLKIRRELDRNTYPKGIKVSDAEMATLNMTQKLIPSRMELQYLAEVSRNEAIVLGRRLSLILSAWTIRRVTSSWTAKMSLSSRSKRSAPRWPPLSASISCG